MSDKIIKIMRAKFVNEIKKESEGSSLSTVGIGKSHMLKTYDYIKTHMPQIIRFADELEDTSLPDKVKDKVCDMLCAESHEVIGISYHEMLSENLADVMQEFTEWTSIKQKNLSTATKYTSDNYQIYVLEPISDKIQIVEVLTYMGTNTISDLTYMFFRVG